MTIPSILRTSLLLLAPVLLGGCGYGPLTNKGYVGPEQELVRMAQPSEHDLENALEHDKIVGILCLRGDQTGRGKDWFDTEVAFAEEHDLDFYTVRLSTSRLPMREQLGDLITIFQSADYPLLMHCQGGADRTGFAAVVYRLVILDEPLDDALESFSFWHGHVERDTPLDQLFEFYRAEADGRTFEEWFQQDYDTERLDAMLDPRPD
jgi:protein tyrosine/serine phosphatase